MITTEMIFLDTDSEPYMFKDQMNVSVPCVFPNVDIKLLDTMGLVELADKVRKANGHKSYEEDDDCYYEFGVTISGPHEGNWKNHISSISFEVMNSTESDNENTYDIELTEEEREVIYDHLNDLCKKEFSQNCDELLKECEEEVEWKIA